MFDIISVSNDNCYNTRAQSKLQLNQFYTRTKSFRNSLFPFIIKEWNQLDAKIRNLPSVSRFKKSLLIYFKTDESSIFDIPNPIGIKLLNRLRLNSIHLNEHKFRHNFRDTVNPYNSAFVMPKLKLPSMSWVALRFPNKEQNSLKASVILMIHY